MEYYECYGYTLLASVLLMWLLYYMWYPSYPHNYPSFDDYRPNNYTFTFYKLAGCGWCTKVTPAWEQLVSGYRGNARLRVVEATANPEETERAGVNSFPTFILTNHVTGQSTKFEGERTAQGLSSFLDKHAA